MARDSSAFCPTLLKTGQIRTGQECGGGVPGRGQLAGGVEGHQHSMTGATSLSQEGRRWSQKAGEFPFPLNLLREAPLGVFSQTVRGCVEGALQ